MRQSWPRATGRGPLQRSVWPSRLGLDSFLEDVSGAAPSVSAQPLSPAGGLARPARVQAFWQDLGSERRPFTRLSKRSGCAVNRACHRADELRRPAPAQGVASRSLGRRQRRRRPCATTAPMRSLVGVAGGCCVGFGYGERALRRRLGAHGGAPRLRGPVAYCRQAPWITGPRT